MLSRLQHNYVRQIPTLLCSSMCDITMFDTMEHYYVRHVVTSNFVHQIANLGACSSHNKVGFCLTHYEKEVLAKF
jgi:hypothetical protein